MGPIKADLDGILPSFDLLGPYRQILMMGFCPIFTDGAQIGRCDGISPFSLMWPIKADFGGMFPRFHLLGTYRQILMAFSLF